MSNNRYFQWVAGDRRGEVVVLDKIEEDDGEVYLAFKDKSRINTEFVAEINSRELTGKMMAEVESPDNVWKFKQISSPEDKPRIEKDWESQVQYEVPSADEIAHADLSSEGGVTRPVPRKKQIELIPPRKTKSKFGDVTSFSEQPQVQTQPNINMSDPVYIMMEKAKKFDTPVPMELIISLPAKSLFNVAKESFDDGAEKVIEYIISNIDDTKLKASLKKALLEAYEDDEAPQPTPLREGTERGNRKMVTTPKPNIVHAQQSKKEPVIGAMYEPEVVEEPIIGEPTLSEDQKLSNDNG